MHIRKGPYGVVENSAIALLFAEQVNRSQSHNNNNNFDALPREGVVKVKFHEKDFHTSCVCSSAFPRKRTRKKIDDFDIEFMNFDVIR